MNDVVYALHEIQGLRGASICDGRGFGAWRMDKPPEATQRETENFRPHVRIEIVCSDEVASAVVNCISENARTGLPGDGLVFTIDVDSCVRIRTGRADELIQ